MTRIQLAEATEEHIQSGPGAGLVESIEVVFSFQLLIDDVRIDGWNSSGFDFETPKSCLKTAASKKKHIHIHTVTHIYINYVHSERHPKFWTSPTSAKILDSISPWGNDNMPLPTSWERAATAKFFRLHKKRHSYYIDLHQSSQHGVKKLPPICSDQDNKRVLTVRGLNLSQKVAGFCCSSSGLGWNCKECFLETFHWIRDTALINTNWLATKIIALRSQRYLKALLGILKQNSRDIFLARDLDSHNKHVRPAESACCFQFQAIWNFEKHPTGVI